MSADGNTHRVDVYGERYQNIRPLDGKGKTSCCRIPATALPHFVNCVESFLVDDRFLRVRNDLPLGFIVFYLFMNLVADDTAFAVNSTSGVLTVIKNISDCGLIPTVWIKRSWIACFPPIGI